MPLTVRVRLKLIAVLIVRVVCVTVGRLKCRLARHRMFGTRISVRCLLRCVTVLSIVLLGTALFGLLVLSLIRYLVGLKLRKWTRDLIVRWLDGKVLCLIRTVGCLVSGWQKSITRRRRPVARSPTVMILRGRVLVIAVSGLWMKWRQGTYGRLLWKRFLIVRAV